MAAPVLTHAWRVASYRLATTVRRHWGGYLSVVLLVGTVGGIAMASFQAARRTQGAYGVYLASTNPPDLEVSAFGPFGTPVRSLTAQITALPGVTQVASGYAPHVLPLAPDGAPRLALTANISFVASLDGAFGSFDRLTVVQGRLANPDRTDEMVLDRNAARILGLHVGSVVPMGLFTEQQGSSPGFGTASVQPVRRFDVRVAGIIVENTIVVEDDVDRAFGFGFLTPALLREAIRVAPQGEDTPVTYIVKLAGGAGAVPRAEGELRAIIPPDAISEFHATSTESTAVALSVRPMSVALAGFGAFAALACLVLAAQAISRLVRERDADRRVLRALGASRLATVADVLVGIFVAIALGVALAIGVAIALSPLSPIGPVRPVYPDRGFAVDLTVYLLGAAVLVVVLAAVAVAQAARAVAQHRGARGPRPSTAARGLEATGAPITSVVGVQFALEPGSARTSVPLRSVLLGTSVAVTLVVATLTFANSLRTLVENPPLYGWNWSLALEPTNNMPLRAAAMLDDDHDIAAWSGMDYNIVTIDGLSIPVLMERTSRPTVIPPVLSGHAVDAPDQIVIGAATLAALHRHVGQTVELSYGTPQSGVTYVAPITMRIVGTATFPAVGFASQVADHTSMGTGALFSESVLPQRFLDAVNSSDPNLGGPDLDFVRLRAGVTQAAGRANLDRIAASVDRIYAGDPNTQMDTVTVLGVLRPAQIVNYGSIGSTPFLLAVGLAAGALAALTVTLLASVRRRRHDLALLKALGFTPGQLASVISWQATVAAVVGIVVGVPCGIALGRELWILFANGLDAVPDPTVPVLEVVAVALGTVLFANLVALVPGRSAGRTRTAVILRAD